MAERDDDHDHRNLQPEGSREPSLRVVGEMQIGGNGRGRQIAPAVLQKECVSGHQIRRITTITVVICMMRSALPLDSWTPLMFVHQK